MITLMIILLIIGGPIVYWIGLGFAPGRVLRTKVNKIYYWGIGERILGSIRVGKSKKDSPPWYLSVIPIPPGLNKIDPDLNWGEVIPASRFNLKNTKVIGVDGKEKEKFQNEIAVDAKGQELYVERSEKVPFLNIYEQVYYLIPIKTSDGFDLTFVLNITYKVIDDMGPIGMPNFKMIGQFDLKSKIQPWAAAKNIDELRLVDIDDLRDSKKGIVFIIEKKDGTEVQLPMQVYLDMQMKRFGCVTHIIALEKYYGDNTAEYLKRKQNQQDLVQEKINQLAFEELQVVERATQLNNAKNDAAIAATEFNAYTEPMGNFLKNIYAGEEQIKKARPGVLFEANKETETIGAIAIKHMFEQIKQVTKENVGAARREQEADHVE